MFDWLEVRGRNLLAVVAQASADDGHERSVLYVVHEILFLNAKTLVTKCSEHERRRNLVEVRVVVRGRPSLKREETEREGFKQRVLLLKAKQPAELFATSSLTCALILEACDGPTRVVRVFELSAHELPAHCEISGPLSFLAGFFTYWHV